MSKLYELRYLSQKFYSDYQNSIYPELE